jgi:hypothetical protein
MAAMNEFAQLIRHIVAEDWDEYDARVQALHDRHAWDGWAEYLGAAFFLAVDRRFKTDEPVSSIIRFVAEARAQFDASGSEIDPAAAEALIRSVLGQVDASGLDDGTIAKIETVLLLKLLTDAGLVGDRLDHFLGDVQPVAERWVSQRTSG